MKRYTDLILVLCLAGILSLGACSDDAWDELPSKVSEFVSEYFPGTTVSSYTDTPGGGHKVVIANGATLIFNSENEWIEIDGEGNSLPEVLIYDQLPPALYDYLQSTEQQSMVYAVKRDRHYYKLMMHDTVITYNIETGAVTYPGQTEEPSVSQ